jgi:hypothetical protein
MTSFLYDFDWDPLKAATNLRKHAVAFEGAVQVFRDPLALTIPDEDHSETEVRWITLGKDVAGRYLLVVHTFDRLTEGRAGIRIISARRPTKAEIRTYEELQ